MCSLGEVDRNFFEDGCIVDEALLRWHYFGEVSASSGAALALCTHILDTARDVKQYSDAQLFIDNDVAGTRSSAECHLRAEATEPQSSAGLCATLDERRAALDVIESACVAMEQSKSELSLATIAASRAAMLNTAFASAFQSTSNGQNSRDTVATSSPWELLHRHVATAPPSQRPSTEEDDALSGADAVDLVVFPVLVVGFHRAENEVQAFDEAVLMHWFSQALSSVPIVNKQLVTPNKALIPLIRRFFHHFSAKRSSAHTKSLFSADRPENFFAFVHALEQQEVRNVLVPHILELVQLHLAANDNGALLARLHSSSIVSLLESTLSLLLWQHAIEFFVTTWNWQDVCRAAERQSARPAAERERRQYDDEAEEERAPRRPTMPVAQRRFLHYCNCLAEFLQSQSASSSAGCQQAKRSIVSDVVFRPNNGRSLRLWCELLSRNVLRTCEAEVALRTLWRREFLYPKDPETRAAPGVLVKLLRGLRASVDAVMHVIPEPRNPPLAPTEGPDLQAIIWNELLGKTVCAFARVFDVGSVMTDDLRCQFTAVLERHSAQLFRTTPMPAQCTAIEHLVDALS